MWQTSAALHPHPVWKYTLSRMEYYHCWTGAESEHRRIRCKLWVRLTIQALKRILLNLDSQRKRPGSPEVILIHEDRELPSLSISPFLDALLTLTEAGVYQHEFYNTYFTRKTITARSSPLRFQSSGKVYVNSIFCIGMYLKLNCDWFHLQHVSAP